MAIKALKLLLLLLLQRCCCVVAVLLMFAIPNAPWWDANAVVLFIFFARTLEYGNCVVNPLLYRCVWAGRGWGGTGRGGAGRCGAGGAGRGGVGQGGAVRGGAGRGGAGRGGVPSVPGLPSKF